jgi:hypothetical protein
MAHQIASLRASVERLQDLVFPLSSNELESQAYPSEWTIAAVLSHLGSGAVIFLRRIDDMLAGKTTPDDFAPSVWDEWNAKSPSAQAADGLEADRALLERLESLSAIERDEFQMAMGPMTFPFSVFVGMRLRCTPGTLR